MLSFLILMGFFSGVSLFPVSQFLVSLVGFRVPGSFIVFHVILSIVFNVILQVFLLTRGWGCHISLALPFPGVGGAGCSGLDRLVERGCCVILPLSVYRWSVAGGDRGCSG